MSLWKGFLGLLVILAAGIARGEQDSRPVNAPVKPPRLLVLKSGRVIHGQIRVRGDGYDVEHSSGKEFVSSQQVWLVAGSLPEAHRLIRDSFQSLTPDVHLQIAAWCSNNQLWGTARGELLDALHKDPHREDARRMLAQLVRRQRAFSEAHVEADSRAVDEAMATKSVMRRRSLGGLTPELAREFTIRIQPLLSNKCVNCHHQNSGREFVMESVKKGSTRAIAQRNLEAVIGQMQTGSSPHDGFLTIATTPHGGMKSGLFRGRLGMTQQQRLSAWLSGVQQHLNVEGQIVANDASVMQVAHKAYMQQSNRHESSTQDVPDINSHTAVRAAGEHEASVMQDIERRLRNDRFNPEIFNQRYRSRAVPYRQSLIR